MLNLITSLKFKQRCTHKVVDEIHFIMATKFRPRIHKEATDVSWVLTFLCSSGYAYNISDIWGQLGKKRNPNSLPNPATDVPHQLWILFK